MSRISTTLILLLFAVSAMAKYKTQTNIHYSQDDDYARERCLVDVYYPTDIKEAPVVVWFHGGGLEGGKKEIPEELREKGLVVIGVNYRLMPKATIDNCIDDAAAAVAWAYRHAEEYNGSPKKLFVAGHSAGGYLTTMIGLEKKWLAKYDMDADAIAGLAPFSGQMITHFNVRKQQGLDALYPTLDIYAPLSHMRADCPPMLIVSGDRELELYGRYEEQAYFWRMMKLLGHKDVTLYEMQGYPHHLMNHPAFYVLTEFIKRLTK